MSRQAALDLVETLDPLRFALRGSRLIEASAGTGKTYTIAALYVRLVLGHGGANAFARPLSPPEILVVTFTDAATQELRERIRRRLAQAAGFFLADPADPADPANSSGDDFLRALRAEYAPSAWAACARTLQLAAEWMDEAAVSTIHGWCNRMLREHAFDSDSLFSQTLAADQSELFAECVRDYWRSFIAPLDAPAVAELRPWWPAPGALQGELRALVGCAETLSVEGTPAEALRDAREARARRLAELKVPWGQWIDEVERILDEAVAGKRVDGRRLQARYYRPWLAALRGWATDAPLQALDLKTGWARLTPDGLREVWKEGEPPAHPAFAAIAQLPAQLDALAQARNAVLSHAARWVAGRFAQEQQRRAQVGFDDLLTRLAAALHGANGTRLAQRIRAQFPVALIDEFQDTDAVQYRIFDAVYRIADDTRDDDHALILIGDPKQAIYGFRGADIYTYLAARRACRGRLSTLRRNFRSTHAMVAATNRCFAAAEQRNVDGDRGGAFLLRGAHGDELPFLAADAHGRSDALIVDGRGHAALTLWWQGGEGGSAPGKGAYVEHMAQVCATQMMRLLKLGQTGGAGFAAPGAAGMEKAALRAVRPADMAVLVNSRNEADAIRGALAARGVRSVYLSDRDSVFACAQAGELQLWLAACAEPDDARRLRAALATATLGVSYAELDALNRDETAWEARVLQFRAYRERWRRHGVLPMLRRLLNDFDVPARLLGGSGSGAGSADSGERVLTDLLHLAELLQQASALLDGEHALIRHLAEQRQEGGAKGAAGAGGSGGASADDPAARQIRLESDADLVQVVTVHKAKGLEYPLVFLPFACASRPVKADDVPLTYHDDDGQAHVALAADEAIVARADRERLGEDLRKFYVALTRARYATWIGVAAFERCALAHLVGQTPSPAALAAWRGDCAQIEIDLAPAIDAARYTASAPGLAGAGAGQARHARRVVGEDWWIASYSALRAEHGGGEGGAQVASLGGTVAQTAAQERFGEARVLPAAEAQPAAADPVTRGGGEGLHDLPRGAEVGSFLHGLLEASARHGFARLATDTRALRDLVERRCRLRGWQGYAAPLATWLEQLLVTPLALPGTLGFAASPLRLAGLGASIAEMEFWMTTQRVDVAAIDRLVCTQTLGGAARPALRQGQLNGMLKGFVDLVFEHDGRYYVADYKSNWLGRSDAAYAPEALRAAMLQARYELQYVLYLVALHRLLRSRLRDYDYDRHVGGALYLFLRATAASGHGVYADRPPRALIEALDRMFAGNAAEGRG